MTTNLHPDRITPEHAARRMSHQERLKNHMPMSPRTGRHPNMPVCIVLKLPEITQNEPVYYDRNCMAYGIQ